MRVFKNYIPYIVILTSGILAYKNIIFSTGPAFHIRDIKDLIFPEYYFIRKAFMGGEFPFWNPYVMLGQPCAFSVALATLYPFLLGFLSLGFLGPLLPRQLELLIVIHLLMSGITMYWGTRKLGLGRLGACVAGIVFQMAIINKDQIFSVPVAFCLPWIPLAFSYGIALFQSKETVLSRSNFSASIIVIISLIFILSTTYPNPILYTYLTLGIVVVFFIISGIIEKNWLGTIIVLGKAFCIFVIPLLLTAFITLPGYAIYRDSIRYNKGALIFGPLYTSHIWTLLFPGFANYIEPPYAYAGIVTIFLAVYFCLTKKNNHINEGFLFVILSIFWFSYSVEGSYLNKLLSCLPIIEKMRLFQFGLIMYVYSVSVMAGKGLERIYRSGDYKIGLNKNWLFPSFIVVMLISSLPYFIKELNRGFSTGNTVAFFFGYIFVLYIVFQRFIISNTMRVALTGIVPAVIILEIFISSPSFVKKSKEAGLSPYTYELNKFAANFPECFLSSDLYRIENFSEYPMAEYWFDRFSAYGYPSRGIQPAKYYYLWNRFGAYGPGYVKWYKEYLNDKVGRLLPLPLNSRIYDLAGIRYFYIAELEWLLIDYRQSGEGEWIEVAIEDKILAAGIGIYNKQDKSDYKFRRILEADLILNDSKVINITIPDEAGWHRFYFVGSEIESFRTNKIKGDSKEGKDFPSLAHRASCIGRGRQRSAMRGKPWVSSIDYFDPIELHKIKIIAKKVSPLGLDEGSVGVVIGEIELLDKNGNKIDIDKKTFNASSTMHVSSPESILDNDTGRVWESWCDVAINKILPNETIEKVSRGCYINSDVLPRAFMVHRYKYVKSESNLLEELHDTNFEPREFVLLQGGYTNFSIPEGPYLDEVNIGRYKLNEVEVSVKNDKPGILVLTDMYMPGWQVFVNGKKDRILEAYGMFRGVFLNAGEHKILFRYTQPLLKLGTIISLITLCLICCVYRIVVSRRK